MSVPALLTHLDLYRVFGPVDQFDRVCDALFVGIELRGVEAAAGGRGEVQGYLTGGEVRRLPHGLYGLTLELSRCARRKSALSRTERDTGVRLFTFTESADCNLKPLRVGRRKVGCAACEADPIVPQGG